MRAGYLVSGLVMAAALTAPAHAQNLTARLLTPLEPAPGMITLMGPHSPELAAYYGIAPQNRPYNLNRRTGPFLNIMAMTGVGATSISVPGQTIPLILQEWGQLTCPNLRPCMLLALDPVGDTFELTEFTVDLYEPVPDPDGGCVIVSGTLTQTLTAQRPIGAPQMVMLQPLAPPQTPPILPNPPAMLAPEDYQLPMFESVNFLPPGIARFEVCGDVPDAHTGQLTYAMTQRGNDWSWQSSGEWQITIQDNGYHGAGHSAVARHLGGSDSFEGLLVNIVPGSTGTLNLTVEPVYDSFAETQYEFDPESNDPPEAIAYRLGFEGRPDLAGKHLLIFSEPPGLPHATGRLNTQESNNPSALALSYFFREFLTAGNEAEVPVTYSQAMTIDPVDFGGMGQPFELSLDLSWRLDTED